MFESILASVLNRYLSNYIDEVDYNNLKVGLFSGKFTKCFQSLSQFKNNNKHILRVKKFRHTRIIKR